ncbi:MAG: enhanced serine sensitivity protein SseB [Actinomycetota bacterium]|nr:enhanced serine sensitivity protein SseB [Actinomycetota bacterium]
MRDGDAPRFVPENPLEDALIAAGDDQERRRRVYEALFGAEVLLPAAGPPPSEDRLWSAPPGSEIDLPVIEHDGLTIVPAFSSLTQLSRYAGEGAGYLKIEVRELMRIWHDDLWLGLNPHGPGILLSPEEVHGLPRPDLRRPPSADTDYMLGVPKVEPTGLLDAIRSYAERSGKIVAAYRAIMLMAEPDATSRIVIGLEMTEGSDGRDVFAEVIEAVRVGEDVDDFLLVPVGVPNAGPVARFLVEQTEPFYGRSR